MPEEYRCPVCGKRFAEKDDYEDHQERDHAEVKELYGEAFGHEQETCPVCTPVRWNTATREERKDALDAHDAFLSQDYLDNDWDNLPQEVQIDLSKKGSEEPQIADEDGGADDPLQKVADLAESYRFLSRDRRAQLFESIGLKQGEANVLAGLEWNELTKPLKKDASEAYAKSQEQQEEKEEEDDEEDEAYENFYNLERYHSSPDFKKRIRCSECNLAFQERKDLDLHYNDVHVPAMAYEADLEDLEEEDYNVDPIDEEDEEDAISY